MKKTILITGATDGIGLETAKSLLSMGHQVLVHGRNAEKLASVVESLSAQGDVESYLADLSLLIEVDALAASILKNHKSLDVLINNAGVYKTKYPLAKNGMDVRFVVNTVAPYLLTQRLLPLLGEQGRVVNLSSAAQASIDFEALLGDRSLKDGPAYAQSKLAITMWSRYLGLKYQEQGPAFLAINPGSLLGSKMVKDAFGITGGDIRIGADILVRAATEEGFDTHTSEYFDNDSGEFAPPHDDALQDSLCEKLVLTIEEILANRQ